MSIIIDFSFKNLKKGRRRSVVSHVQSNRHTFPFENALCFIKDHATRDSSPNLPLFYPRLQKQRLQKRLPLSLVSPGCWLRKQRVAENTSSKSTTMSSRRRRPCGTPRRSRRQESLGRTAGSGRRQFFVVRPVLGTTLVGDVSGRRRGHGRVRDARE